MSTAKKLISVADLVDRLGRTKVEIADLKKIEDKDVGVLKKRGVGEYVGTLFQALIFKQDRDKVTNWEAVAKELKAAASLVKQYSVTKTVTTIDWEAIAKQLEPSEEIIKKHTTVGQQVTVCKVTARQ